MLDKASKPRTLPDRFCGADAWSKLSKVQQDEIGALALELAHAGRSRALNRDPVIGRALDAAGDLLTERLDTAVVPAIGEFNPSFRVRLPSRLGGVCRCCGCTENDACQGGCSWVDFDLCSSCAPRAN